jgi:hypothetical protein
MCIIIKLELCKEVAVKSMPKCLIICMQGRKAIFQEDDGIALHELRVINYRSYFMEQNLFMKNAILDFNNKDEGDDL